MAGLGHLGLGSLHVDFCDCERVIERESQPTHLTTKEHFFDFCCGHCDQGPYTQASAPANALRKASENILSTTTPRKKPACSTQAGFITDGITSTHTYRHVSIFLLTHRCVEQRIHRRSQWPGQNPGSAKTTVTVIPSLGLF